MPSPIEQQHSGHRILTPIRFAKYLVEIIRDCCSCTRLAALYVSTNGPYPIIPDVLCYPIFAQYYSGPYPVICHPPCGPWGPCKTLCKYQTRDGGIHSIEMVHRYGGVIEQPISSSLFRDYGRPGSIIKTVNQGDFGHKLPKPTLLYFVCTHAAKTKLSTTPTD